MSTTGKGPHLSEEEVGAYVAALDHSDGETRRDLTARLAWRPAWAIRSRKNALKEFLALFGFGSADR